VTVRRGRRRKQLLDDLKEKRGYWKLKDEAIDRTLWRTGFVRVYGPVVRQTREWTVIGYGMDYPAVRILRAGREACFLRNVETGSGGPPSLLLNRYRRSYSGGKTAEPSG
jgi:hypothetical protein